MKKLANELNPSGQIFPLDNPYNLEIQIDEDGRPCTKYGYSKSNDVHAIGDGLIWCCMDCNRELTQPELEQCDDGNSILSNCLDCSAKPHNVCGNKDCKKQVDYHDDSLCNKHKRIEFERTHPTEMISYSNGACASILRMN
jgi:hypothetical protein